MLLLSNFSLTISSLNIDYSFAAEAYRIGLLMKRR